MSQTQPFSPAVLAWFEQGDTLATRPEQAGYQPFSRTSWRTTTATVAAAVAALSSALWILS